MTKPLPKADIKLEIRLNEVETDSASRAAYDTVYAEADISQYYSYYLWLMDLLALEPGQQYLDISCGRAILPREAEARGVAAHGLDLSFNALHSGRLPGGRPRLVTGNSQQLPYAANSIDVMSNIGSLEHYTDMPAAVQEMARVLRPEGRAIILVPNTFSLLTNIWIAFRQGRTSYDPYQPIQRYAARQEWQDLLTENGLTVKKTLKYERVRPRNWADCRYYLRRPKELLRLLLTPFVPLNLAFCFIFICGKSTTEKPGGV